MAHPIRQCVLANSTSYGFPWCPVADAGKALIVAREGREDLLNNVANKVESGEYYYNIGHIEGICPGCIAVGWYLAEGVAYTIGLLIRQDRARRGKVWHWDRGLFPLGDDA